MTFRSHVAGHLLRLVIIAVLVLQGMIGGALATRMATTQAIAGPGDTVVICTPEGFKTVLWSDVSDNQIPRTFGCACPCTASCGSCGAGAPMLVALLVDYGGNSQTVALVGETSVMPPGSCAVTPGGARAPPLLAV